MDLQERGALISARIRACSYPGDRKKALEDANRLAEEDSLVAGTYLIECIGNLLMEKRIEEPELLYSLTNKIFRGRSGDEFIDILYKKENLVIKLLEELMQEESIEEKEEVVKYIAERKPKEIAEAVMGFNQQNTLFFHAFNGNRVIIEVFTKVFVYSSSFRQFLMFNGFIEAMQMLSLKAQERESARSALIFLSEIIRCGVEGAKYFMQTKWETWIKSMLDRYTHHALRVIYSLAAYEGTRMYLLSLLPELLHAKDPLALSLVVQHAQIDEAEDQSLAEKVIEVVKEGELSHCPMRANCSLLLSLCVNPLLLHRYKPGDIFFLASLLSTLERQLDLDNAYPTQNEEVSHFLQQLPQITLMRPVKAIIFLKTAITLMLGVSGVNKVNESMYSTETINALREIVEADRAILPIKSLSALWLAKAYLQIEEREGTTAVEEKWSLFAQMHDNIISLYRNLLSSLVAPPFHCSTIPNNNTSCSEGCKRCYLKGVSAAGGELPTAALLLSSPLWVPPSLHARILYLFGGYLMRVEARKGPREKLRLKNQAEQAAKTSKAVPAAKPTSTDIKKGANVFDL